MLAQTSIRDNRELRILGTTITVAVPFCIYTIGKYCQPLLSYLWPQSLTRYIEGRNGFVPQDEKGLVRTEY